MQRRDTLIHSSKEWVDYQNRTTRLGQTSLTTYKALKIIGYRLKSNKFIKIGKEHTSLPFIFTFRAVFDPIETFLDLKRANTSKTAFVQI